MAMVTACTWSLTRRWLQRIVINGKRRKIGLGGWPTVSLAEARERAIVNLGIVRAAGWLLLSINPASDPIPWDDGMEVWTRVPRDMKFVFGLLILGLVLGLACAPPEPAPASTPVRVFVGTTKLVPTPKATPVPSDWQEKIETDALSDTRRVILTTRATAHNLEWPYTAPTLVIRCNEEGSIRYEVAVHWEKYMAKPNQRRSFESKVRWGDNPATGAQWSESTNNEATFHKSPFRFIENALSARTVLIRVWDYSGVEHDAKFRVHGLRGHIKNNPELCYQVK